MSFLSPDTNCGCVEIQVFPKTRSALQPWRGWKKTVCFKNRSFCERRKAFPGLNGRSFVRSTIFMQPFQSRFEDRSLYQSEAPSHWRVYTSAASRSGLTTQCEQPLAHKMDCFKYFFKKNHFFKITIFVLYPSYGYAIGKSFLIRGLSALPFFCGKDLISSFRFQNQNNHRCAISAFMMEGDLYAGWGKIRR